MKKLFLLFLAVPNMVFAINQNTIFDDGRWYLEKNTLTTKLYSRYYSISYTTPSGMHGESESCTLSSPTQLSCPQSSVTYNADAHSATLQQLSETITYYEKGFTPEPNPLTGNWHLHGDQMRCGKVFTTITIPYHEKQAKQFKNISTSDPWGHSDGMTFQLVQNPNRSNHLELTNGSMALYLYDAADRPINDFNKLSTLAKLDLDSYSKYLPECTFSKN